MQKKLLTLGKIVITLALVFWLIERVNWQVVLTQLSTITWPLLFLYIIYQLLGNLISAKKWQTIGHFKGLDFSLRDAFFTYLTGSFINNFLPSTIGGDAYRAIWLANRSGARAASISTVIFDRFIGLWTIALLALFFSPVLFPYIKDSVSLSITYIILIIFFVIDLVITYAYCQEWFHRLIERLPIFKLRRFLEEIIFYTKKHIWLKTSLWSALFISVGLVLSNFTLFHALGSDIGIIPFASVMFLVAIVSSVPLSINNIGIKEWAYITFFGLVGVSVETAVTVALLSRFIQMLISFIAVPQYLREEDSEKGEL